MSSRQQNLTLTAQTTTSAVSPMAAQSQQRPRARPRLCLDYVTIYGKNHPPSTAQNQPSSTTKAIKVEKAGDTGLPVFKVGLSDPLNKRSIVISNTDFSTEELDNRNSPIRPAKDKTTTYNIQSQQSQQNRPKKHQRKSKRQK